MFGKWELCLEGWRDLWMVSDNNYVDGQCISVAVFVHIISSSYVHIQIIYCLVRFTLLWL